ncbi:MAG TPA: AsnC family transcriptional regulator [Jatrophihabitans sp.]|nr:AsnC family transcriptional regulator [Jatrophihabitans sp.]
MNIDEHILAALAANDRGPLSISELARRLGISPQIVLPAAHRLVDGGRADAALATVHGVPTLRGLMHRRVPTPGGE